MFGVLYGDVIGSYYENHCTKDYDFELQKDSTFTDDSVLTTAVCRAILNDSEPIKWLGLGKRALLYAGQFKQYYSHYPNVAYSNPFIEWGTMAGFQKVSQYDGVAAAKAAPIGCAYDTLEQVQLQAEASCLYTHKSREAIKAAQAVASAVFLAKSGASKEEIRKYIKQKYHYHLNTTVEEIRQKHVFNPQASYSVPPAIVAFLDSTDYESAVRNAVSLGGDADTQAAIAGGIAQAFYREIPAHIVEFCNGKINPMLKATVREFEEKFLG